MEYNNKKIMEVMNEILENKSFMKLNTKQGTVIIDIQTAYLISQVWEKSTLELKEKIEKHWKINEAVCLQKIWKMVEGNYIRGSK